MAKLHDSIRQYTGGRVTPGRKASQGRMDPLKQTWPPQRMGTPQGVAVQTSDGSAVESDMGRVPGVGTGPTTEAMPSFPAPKSNLRTVAPGYELKTDEMNDPEVQKMLQESGDNNFYPQESRDI